MNDEREPVKEVPLPRRVTLFVRQADLRNGDLILKIGDKVRTGQKLRLLEEDNGYLISTVTGTIADISDYTGYLAQNYSRISIDTAEEDHWDDEFDRGDRAPTAENVLEFLRCIPGASDLASLLDRKPPLDTIIIRGIDKEPLITTNQLVLKAEIEGLSRGVDYLRGITGTSKIIIVVPPNLASQAKKTGAEVRVIDPVYPNALPHIIMKNILGKIPLAGKSCEDTGAGFINAEAVMALANAFIKGKLPVNKMLTVIKKDNTRVNVIARIGTPVKDILDTLQIETGHGDRLILGGPMTGNSIYSLDMPVLADTDAVMIQDKSRIIENSESHCVNCGECVRVCPATVPVNMLVRVLENGLYEEAVSQYDLLSCIECGLCNLVCIARIPIFHYIMLGKYEFARIKAAEGSNA